MIDFFKRLFGQSGSSATAKERLRLVLMTDHLALAPEIVDAMKRDLVDVISRYVEVDREHIEVNFEQQDKALAMLANIPILSVNRPSSSAQPKQAPTPSPAAAPNVTSPAHAQTDDSIAVRRRRRRRRKAQAQSQGMVAASSS